MSHTPGPWRYVECDNAIISDSADRPRLVDIVPRSCDVCEEARTANGRRIVACVNGCADIANPAAIPVAIKVLEDMAAWMCGAGTRGRADMMVIADNALRLLRNEL